MTTAIEYWERRKSEFPYHHETTSNIARPEDFDAHYHLFASFMYVHSNGTYYWGFKDRRDLELLKKVEEDGK